MKINKIYFKNNFIDNYKKYNMIQNNSLYKSSEDALYLTEFIKIFISKHKLLTNYKLLDIGSGNGVIDVLLWDSFLKYYYKTFKMTCVEIQNELFKLSLQNFKKYNMQNIITAYNTDIKLFQINNTKYDIIFSNPPYYPIENTLISPNQSIALAKFEKALNLFDFLKISKVLIKKNGHLIFINIENNYNRIKYYAEKLNITKINFYKIISNKKNNFLICIVSN